MDYEQLYKTLARAIIKAEGRIGGDTAAFVAEFAARLPQSGVALDGEAQAALDAYLGDMEAAVKTSIAEAVLVGAGTQVTAAALESAWALEAAERAFAARWPDGLTLSRRLWDWREDTRLGIERELKNGVRQGQAVGKTLYAMQRAVERAPGARRFEIVQNHTDDWVAGLRRSAAAAIHNLEGRAAWQGALDTVRRHIDTLKATGTRPAAERVLGQIQAAVDKGRADLLDHAVKWWVYDRQLYHLKRIVRTEMATAAHNAVIDGTVEDPGIIGYQWRLSASHRVPDICDYYAGIEMGLGRGVWTKEAVPRHKAHPHCLCLLIPRVSPVRRKGDRNYPDFIKNAPPSVREAMLPEWAKAAIKNGTPLHGLIRPDGLGLVTHQTLKAQSPFEAARYKGGAHHGWYLQQQGLTDAELQKGIKSLQKQIDKHRSWIDNPLLKIPNFKAFHPDRQQHLIERKWPQDIQRHQALIAILEGILRKRNHDRAN